LISTVIMAIVSFASTNIDDLLVLILFFSQINHVLERRHIIIGQYFGIGALTTISIIGAFGISVFPHEYVGLLGLVPIYLGAKMYVVKKESQERGDTCQSLISPNVVSVFSVTFANGGDNIGVYIPLFTSMSLAGVLVTVIIFGLLTALWCFIALKLTERPIVQRNIEKYKQLVVPIIYIGLGVYILMKNDTLSFIWEKVF
jgi:cadmium resistance transport/sequestration family protein